MEVIEDLVRGSEIVHSLDGVSLVRILEVRNLTQGEASNRLHFAIEAARIKSGDPHPTIPDLICEDVRAEPWAGTAKNAFRVIARYMDGAAVLIRVNGTVVRTQKHFNAAGELMVVYYWPGGDGARPANAAKAPAEAIIPEGHTLLEFERIVRDPPKETHEKYFNRVNSKKWQGRLPHQWHLLDHSFSPSRGSFSNRVYRERFAFEGMPANTGTGPTLTFDPINVFIDRNTGRVPTDASSVSDRVNEASGWKREKVLEEADFSKIGLPDIL